MFTGIIEAIGTVQKKVGGKLTLSRPTSFADLKLGSSVSVSGVCLSIVALTKEEMSFDVVLETFSKTNLGKLKTGSKVNLERSMAKNARFEGHIVQGHSEGVAVVKKAGTDFIITLPRELLTFVLPKGSITIEGVSLTVASLDGDECHIALIPHTLKHTTLGSLKKGDKVNIETDIMIRALLQDLGRGSLTKKKRL